MNERVAWLLWFLLLSTVGQAAMVSIPLTATVNDQEVGELMAVLEDEQLRAVEINPIREKLQELLKPAAYALLQTHSGGPVSIRDLEAVGIDTRFDFQSLRIHLVIRRDLLRQKDLNLLGPINFTAGRTVRPSEFSAYMNIRGGITHAESTSSERQGLDEPHVSLENAFNFRGIVLENETLLDSQGGKVWEKRDTRLTWDQPDKRWRWELGDLNYPVTSFQGFVPMAGLSLRKDDSLQPYRLTSPLGQTAFFLKENSRVEVLVNGQTIRTMQLNAGPHQISNFPLTLGANNVILRITDPVGRVEYIQSTLFYDPALLKGGEREFNAAVGMPSVPDPDEPIYRYSAHPAASAFYRWGLTDHLMLGVNGQATEDTQQCGAEGAVNTKAGTVTLESALSHDREAGLGHAGRLQYQYFFPSQALLADGLFSASAEYRSSAFSLASPFERTHSQYSVYSAQANYSQRISDLWSVGGGYSHLWADGRNQREAYSLTAGWFWRGTHANLSVERIRDLDGPPGWGAFLFFTFNFSSSHSFYSSYDSRSHISRAEWQYTGRESIETFSTSVGVQNTPDATSGFGSIHYTGRRTELTLSQDIVSRDENLISLRWGSAIVFADGSWGISRPVSDSFAIVESEGPLRESGGVGVQSLGERFLAQEDWLGPAVLPQLTSYYPIHVAAEARQASADFDPQTGDLRIEPTYRSGTRVLLGQRALLNVSLRLIWADGKPVALQAGLLKSATLGDAEFISNREGIVYVQGLKAGTYQASLASYPDRLFTLSIPAGKENDLNLGEIRLPYKE